MVTDLEQQGSQGLDISLWHFQGPWFLGTQKDSGGLVKIGGALGGHFPAEGEQGAPPLLLLPRFMVPA